MSLSPKKSTALKFQDSPSLFLSTLPNLQTHSKTTTHTHTHTYISTLLVPLTSLKIPARPGTPTLSLIYAEQPVYTLHKPPLLSRTCARRRRRLMHSTRARKKKKGVERERERERENINAYTNRSIETLARSLARANSLSVIPPAALVAAHSPRTFLSCVYSPARAASGGPAFKFSIVAPHVGIYTYYSSSKGARLLFLIVRGCGEYLPVTLGRARVRPPVWELCNVYINNWYTEGFLKNFLYQWTACVCVKMKGVIE